MNFIWYFKVTKQRYVDFRIDDVYMFITVPQEQKFLAGIYVFCIKNGQNSMNVKVNDQHL